MQYLCEAKLVAGQTPGFARFLTRIRTLLRVYCTTVQGELGSCGITLCPPKPRSSGASTRQTSRGVPCLLLRIYPVKRHNRALSGHRFVKLREECHACRYKFPLFENSERMSSRLESF